MWGGGSGGGSDLQNTVLYVAYLQAVMDRHDVRTVVDLGCGDWRFSKHLNFNGRNYLGFDIVPAVIATNIAKYGASNIRFEQVDITELSARPNCDLIVCKDVLRHLSNQNVATVLEKCHAARLVLITNDYNPANVENTNGGTRPLDISRPPFNYLARPVCRIGAKVVFRG